MMNMIDFLLRALSGLALGYAIGWLHWRLLRWNSRLYLAAVPLRQALLLHLLRCGVTGLALYASARAGVWLAPLLLGILAARSLQLRRQA